jgi:uncharacterized repeat protein (TIGR02543 family)
MGVGQTVTGAYQYEGTDAEANSIYTWYTSNDQSGQNRTVTATMATNYTILADDNGKYLFFEVQPVNQQGNTGASVVSDAFGGSVTAASISSTEPVVLTESAANDGSLDPNTIVITIVDGTLAEDIAKADVTASNLPPGLDYTITRTDTVHLAITITGQAVGHANNDDVYNVTFTISGARVEGAESDLTTANIGIDFSDPAVTGTLTINVTGQGSVLKNPDRVTYTVNETVELTAAPLTGWSFSHWSGDLSGNTIQANIIMDGNKTVTAVFTINSYNVTFDSQGGAEIDSQDITYNSLVTEPAAPARDDFTFAGWHRDSTCTRPWKFDTDRITANTVLYAGWKTAVDNGGQDGQAQIDNGVTDLQMGDSESLDLQAGVQSANGTQIIIGGAAENLEDYTGGGLVSANLTEPLDIGGSSVQIQQAVRLESGVDGAPIIITNSGNSSISLTIPDGATIMADNNWDGTLIPPKAVSGNATGTAASGFSVGNTVIEAGSPSGVLIFDKPVILELKGVSGPVGYRPAGSDIWTQITVLAGGTYENPAAPGFPGEAYISNGTDTKIITWHLTGFAGLLVTPAAPANPVVDDNNDTFGWTDTPGYAGVSEYEFSVNIGAAWADCTANPQSVGDFDYATGAVQVRVKENATAGRTAGSALLSTEAFTAASVLPAATVTEVFSSANPSVYGQQVTFVASVTSIAGTPYGIVVFAIDGTNLGSPVNLSNGVASCAGISSLEPGSHTVTATYTGSSNYAASTGLLAQTVYYIPPTTAATLSPEITETPGAVNPNGTYTADVAVLSTDNNAVLFIPAGVTGKTAGGQPLDDILIVPISAPPPPPDGRVIIGIAYEFYPDGATFSPPATLTFTFNADSLPPDTEPVIAWYDKAAGTWVQCDDCVIDYVNQTISVKVSHFTGFAVLTLLQTAEPAASAPVTTAAPEQPVTIAAEKPKPSIVYIIPPPSSTSPPALPPPAPKSTGWPMWIWITGGLVAAILMIIIYFKKRRD